jgi:hypothetical protein
MVSVNNVMVGFGMSSSLFLKEACPNKSLQICAGEPEGVAVLRSGANPSNEGGLGRPRSEDEFTQLNFCLGIKVQPFSRFKVEP